MTVVTFVAVVAAASTSAKRVRNERRARNTAARQPVPSGRTRRRCPGPDLNGVPVTNNGPVSNAMASSFLNGPGVRCGMGGRQRGRNGLSV